MSVHNWGEDPKGLWTIKIMDTTGKPENHGQLDDFRLVLHGTAEAPHHMKAGPRVYDEHYNTVQNERSEKRQSLKAINDQQMIVESNKLSSIPQHRQHMSEDKQVEPTTNTETDSHWLRLLSRLNGNWLQ